MQMKLATAALLGLVLVAAAACSGGDDAKIADLEERVEAAEEARQEAEQEAERQRQAAEQAERERREAEQAEQEAERERQAAEQAEQEAEEARQAAEAERQRLADEAERAQQRLDAAAAMRALAGTRTRGGATLDAAPRYNAPASITAPTLTGTPSTSSAGRWLKTTLSSRTTARRDMIEIYSDREAPKRSPFATSSYNSGNTVINTEGVVVGNVTIANADHSRLVASGSFPRSSGEPQPYNLVDRGPTQTEIDADPNDDITGTGRDETRHPLRYSVEVSGSLQGASGRFRCGGADTSTACTVQNRGGSFHFGGTWVFIPSSGTVQILSDDAEFMWFGWWSRYTVSNDTWAFVADHGGNALSDVSAATGTATYRGTAAGHYAIAEPVGGESGLGSFTASATLQADFDTNTVSGSITGFSNAPDWSLALKSGDISGGTTGNDGTDSADPGGVTWTINGNPAADSGAWEAAFYSNLPVAESTGVVPYGIAGTFEADYGSTAELIGAFGAHR